MPYTGDYAVTLPSMFPAPGEVLGQAVAQKRADTQYERELANQKQKQDEADQWKKLNLIQDMTDISKYQTASDVANAIGNTQAQKILQKYTAQASQMQPAELQAKISQEMGGLTNGLGGIKAELDDADSGFKSLKQQFPELDIASMVKDYRADVIQRRVDNGGNFVNPLSVAPSNIDLTNPDILARYVTGNKNLTESIINPKGADKQELLMGSKGDYTKWEGNLPYWKKPNYDQSKFNGEGFYTGKEMPGFQIKKTTLPSGTLNASKDKPFEMIDEDVYRKFSEDTKSNIELISATKNQFPNYDNFNQTEKDYAKRNVLLKHIESLDQSQLHPTFSTRPMRVSVNTGGNSSNQPVNWDLTEYPDVPGGGKDVTVPFQGYKVTAIGGETLLAKNVIYNPEKKKFIVTEYTGRDALGNPTGESVTEVSTQTMRQNIQGMNPAADMRPFDALVKGNPVVGKQPEQSKSKPATQKEDNAGGGMKVMTYSVGGKTLTQDQIQKGAAKYNMSVNDYLKSIGAK